MDSLFYVYIAGLLVGGVVVLLSALGGLGGADIDVDAGVDADIGGDADFAGDADIHGAGGVNVLSFLKIRRIFFFAFFFGLTGLLTGLGMGSVGTLLTALGTGLVCAWLGDWIISRLTTSAASSSLEPEDYIGLEARVTVPIASGGRGKIAGVLKGHNIEFLARASQEGQELAPGVQVLVLSVEDGVAVVDVQQ